MLLLLLGNANLGWEHFIPTVWLWVVGQNLQTEVDTCHQFCSWSPTLIMLTFGLARCHFETQSVCLGLVSLKDFCMDVFFGQKPVNLEQNFSVAKATLESQMSVR